MEEYLDQYPSRINQRSQSGTTMLIVAACHDNHQMVRLLLRRGANPMMGDDDGHILDQTSRRCHAIINSWMLGNRTNRQYKSPTIIPSQFTG